MYLYNKNTMHYYEVLVGSNQYHGDKPLTYQFDELLPLGSIVSVPLRRKPVMGIITGMVSQPTFPTKPIKKVVTQKPLPKVLIDLRGWIASYYPARSGIITQLFLPSSLLQTERKSIVRSEKTLPPVATLPPLTDEQTAVMDTIKSSRSQSFLLHGDTGSGKTRVYMELARQVLDNDKSVIVLVPEISLTPQLAQSFQTAFRERVLIMHSNLTPAERRTIWNNVHNAQSPIIIIGPRSALFVPMADVGLIIVDEAHDGAYKQDQAPHYHALRAAAKLATLHRAKIIMGSATPTVSDYYIAQSRHVPILRMTQLPAQTKQTETEVKIVDLRERQFFTRQQHLSDHLLDAIEQALQRGEQALVFLNRRGTARLVMCQNCGWQALCPHCDLPLTYHGDIHEMRCHTCGFHESAPASCPVCNSTDITFKSIGTKLIAAELAHTFPRATIKRFDTDNSKTERLEQHYDDIKSGKVDILVGTQLLAKGLDLPKLTLVGVVLADTSLYFPDYSAAERTMQLLTQVLGRIGRGHLSHSTAVIQTYDPSSLVIEAAIKKDWLSFYEREIAERKLFMFPPFCFALKVWVERASSAGAAAAANKLVELVQAMPLRIEINGPVPAFHTRVNKKYRWQIIIKAKERNELIKVIAALPSGWSYDIDPTNLL